MPYQIKNGIIYSGNAVTLTQAQYDALTTAEKNNGTVYYIYDSDAMIEAQEVGLDGGNVEDLAGSVATIETSPATANHEVGEYILWNGVLYTVTSAIATGENLVVNSNISATTVGTELTALNNGLWDWETFQGTVGGVAQTFYRKRLGNAYIIFGAGSVNAPIGAGTTSQRQIVFSSKAFTQAIGGAANLAVAGQVDSYARYVNVGCDRVDAWVYNSSAATVNTLMYSFIVIGV